MTPVPPTARPWTIVRYAERTLLTLLPQGGQGGSRRNALLALGVGTPPPGRPSTPSRVASERG